MTAVAIPERLAKASPRAKARLAGLFEFLEGLTSAGGQVMILDRLTVSHDPAATAANLLAHPKLYWLGFCSSLAAVAFHLAWAWLFYELFEPVNRSVARLAALVIAVGCAIQAVTSLLYIAPLLILQSATTSFSAFPPAQLQALAYAFLKLNEQAFDIYLVFFGIWCALSGYLILKSRFMPRILGALLMLDGVGWSLYIYPPLAYPLFPVIAAISAISELPLELWLLIFGVHPERWKEQARDAS